MFSDRRQDLLRLARVAGLCLFIATVALPGLAPSTRALTLFFLAGVFSLAAVYELSVRQAPQHWMMLWVLAIFAGAALAWAGLDYFFPARIAPQGVLVAANDPAPRFGCSKLKPPIAKDDLVMLFGADRIVGRGKVPFVPARIGTCPAFTVTRGAGGLLIDAFGYNSGDDVVYRIEKNRFHMIVRGFSKAERPDASTLIVSDDTGHQSFYLRYLNRNTVRVRGIFRCGDSDPVTVSDDAVTIGTHRVTPSCASATAGTPYGIEYAN